MNHASPSASHPEAGPYARALVAGLSLGLRRCDPHGFNPLLLEPLGGMLLLTLLLQSGPAVLLVRIVCQHLFEAAYSVAPFHSSGQLAPQVSVVHRVNEVGHALLDVPLQGFRNRQITTLRIAEHSLCLVQFLLLPGIETPSDSLAFLERIPDVCRNTHDAPGVRIK